MSQETLAPSAPAVAGQSFVDRMKALRRTQLASISTAAPTQGGRNSILDAQVPEGVSSASAAAAPAPARPLPGTAAPVAAPFAIHDPLTAPLAQVQADFEIVLPMMTKYWGYDEQDVDCLRKVNGADEASLRSYVHASMLTVVILQGVPVTAAFQQRCSALFRTDYAQADARRQEGASEKARARLGIKASDAVQAVPAAPRAPEPVAAELPLAAPVPAKASPLATTIAGIARAPVPAPAPTPAPVMVAPAAPVQALKGTIAPAGQAIEERAKALAAALEAKRMKRMRP